jgi:hypothetical protein
MPFWDNILHAVAAPEEAAPKRWKTIAEGSLKHPS